VQTVAPRSRRAGGRADDMPYEQALVQDFHRRIS
jgi:hypothetical protein